mmetsp:Transcript_65874/g.77401  ORF Transcript_65874/g.77401 Transcript_65874/m.77401 type:complete len:690 (+) Transcript_65874:98-2167(+)
MLSPCPCTDGLDDISKDITKCMTDISQYNDLQLIQRSDVRKKEIISQLRNFIRTLQSASCSAKDNLRKNLDIAPMSSRSAYLMSLKDLIGIEPELLWSEDEWPNLVEEYDRLSGQSGLSEEKKNWAIDFTVEGETSKSYRKSAINNLVKHRGWSHSDARAYTCLQSVRAAMAYAMRDRKTSFAASTYKICDILYRNRVSRDNEPPLMLFKHLHGLYSLSDDDPTWVEILNVDCKGFRGLTCTAMLQLTREAPFFTPNGFAQRHRKDGREEFIPVEGEIVGFESRVDTHTGIHAATLLDEAGETGAFPPNCLYRVKEVQPAGTWISPAGNYPEVDLIIVTATYLPHGSIFDKKGAGKMCGNSHMLTYGSRKEYMRGLNDFLYDPILTMAQEFDRQYKWTDWKGIQHTLQECWAYVNGPAVTMEDCTPGTRDEGNNGKTPEQFLSDVNTLIKERRDQGYPSQNKQCDLENALLIQDEVLAVRIYSGPAYQVINNFLRQVSTLDGDFRSEIVQHAELTMAATIGHIINAIRKLSAIVNDEELKAPLYRCIRGELPRIFWLTDEFNMLCATDGGFFSTSRCQLENYMELGDHNVMWNVLPSAEMDDAHHYGADISILSQFAAESEVLFPPCTMLVVNKLKNESLSRIESIDKAFVDTSDKQYSERRAINGEEKYDRYQRTKTFLSINATPCFI